MISLKKDKFSFSFPLPDYQNTNQNSIINELIMQIIEINYKITRLTNDLTKYDEIEAYRIYNSYMFLFAKSIFDDDKIYCTEGINEVNKYLASCHILPVDEKQQSPVDDYLTAARRSLHSCIINLNKGYLIGLLRSLSAANYWLGLAEGCHKTAKIADEKKKAAAKHAADIRHMPSRSLKDEAIQYYIAHRNDFKTRDDAAFYIANNVVKSAYSTVRGHIRNI